MSATLLEAPQRRAAPPPPPAPPSHGPPRPRPRPGRSALPIGIVVSVLVHIIVLGLRFTAPSPDAALPSTPQVVNLPPSPAMRVFDIVGVVAEVPTPQVTIAEPDEPQPTPLLTPPVQAPAPESAPREPAAARREAPLTVTERITPRSGGDPRLFERATDPLRPELDPLNNVRARVYGSIEAYNDSIAAEAAARARGLDWSVRDKNGGRWGVSPGGIHLGNVTLPLPALGASAGERAAMREWSDIQQQAGRRQVEETFDDRVRAIRARRDAARDSARRGGGGN